MRKNYIKLNKNWRILRDQLLNPQLNEKVLDQALTTASQQQEPIVIWLLGKTQSGKTSIIRALTGSDNAQIGNGFKPCTKTSRFYDFPNHAPIVRFLDTRGLGEVDYDPSKDISYCESRAHLVIAVMKASDMDQEAVCKVLRTIRKRHPDWPIVIAQSALHELYPPGAQHQPYPFEQENWGLVVPPNLNRALLSQQESLRKFTGNAPVLWIPVDFTLPEDGFEPQYYGLDTLWSAIETVTTYGLLRLLRANQRVKNVYADATHPHIMGYSLAAAAIGALPVVDMALVPTLQLKLLHTLAALYNVSWTARSSTEFFGLLGVGFAANYGLRWSGRALLKLIPAWGQTLGAVWGATTSGAITFALGKSACYYLEHKNKGVNINAKALRHVYAQAFAQGRQLTAFQKQETQTITALLNAAPTDEQNKP